MNRIHLDQNKRHHFQHHKRRAEEDKMGIGESSKVTLSVNWGARGNLLKGRGSKEEEGGLKRELKF